MGYSTEFSGELKFKGDVTAKELAKLSAFLGEDCRKHPEWGATDLYYVDLMLCEDFSGIKWNGAEKTYGMPQLVNMITSIMKEDFPDFELEGEMLAQGEDIDDRWKLIMSEGVATKKELPHEGQKIICPHCENHFYL